MIRRPVYLPAKGLPKPTPQQQALAEWRRIDLREQEGAMAGGAGKSVADLVPKVVQGMGLERKRGELEILRVWNELLDPQITKHAQPVNLVRGTLFVKVDNSVWVDEIVRYRRKEILNRLQTAFGKDLVQRLSIRVG